MHMKDLTDFKTRKPSRGGRRHHAGAANLRSFIANHYQGFVDLEYEVHPDDPMPGVQQFFRLHARNAGGHAGLMLTRG